MWSVNGRMAFGIFDLVIKSSCSNSPKIIAVPSLVRVDSLILIGVIIAEFAEI